MKNQILITLLLLCWQTVHAQGFVNMNFENATIVQDASSPYYPYAVYTSSAIPGWAVTGNFLGPNDILYNDISLGSSSVALLGTGNNMPVPNSLDGAYSIDLYGGLGVPSGVSISQTGLVPANAVSISFIAQAGNGTLIVSLGGQNISFLSISTGTGYTLYGGNIPLALAGQSEQLVFQALEGGNNYWEIDDIQFSPTAVPEPSEFVFGVLGIALFSVRRWRIAAAP